MVGGIVVVVVLVGGALVADRVTHSTAERRVAEAIEQNLDVVGTPTVDIGGFPFLTQLLAGSVDDLPGAIGDRLTDIEIPVSGLPEGLVLSDATVVADGVRITADGADVVLPTEAPPAG